MGEGVLDGSRWAQSQECHRCKPNKSAASPLGESLLATTEAAAATAMAECAAPCACLLICILGQRSF